MASPLSTSEDAYDIRKLKIVSYNLHGINNGRSFLVDLCNDSDVSIVAVQEHWLTDDNLYQLNNIHPDFTGYGISAMTKKLSTGIYRGRPFGGVGFLWRKSLADQIAVDSCSDDSRCLIIKLKMLSNVYLKIINVYFPCYSGSSEYKIELGHCLGFLDNNILPDESVIVLGDMNFECDNNNAGFTQCSKVFSSAGIVCCDHLVRTNSECVIYCNTSLGQASFIDHIFLCHAVLLIVL